MRPVRSLWVSIMGVGAALAVASCNDQVTETNIAPDVTVLPSFERNAGQFNLSSGFTPVASSAACSVGGGLSQFVLPDGFVATLVSSEPSFPDLPDMSTVNETGHNAGRFLYRTHEIAPNAGVTETDLETGQTRLVAQRNDWQRFDGLVWTPWGTLITGEEVNPDPNNIPDPDFPNATAGLAYEIDPQTGSTQARPALGVSPTKVSGLMSPETSIPYPSDHRGSFSSSYRMAAVTSRQANSTHCGWWRIWGIVLVGASG